MAIRFQRAFDPTMGLVMQATAKVAHFVSIMDVVDAYIPPFLLFHITNFLQGVRVGAEGGFCRAACTLGKRE